MMSRFDKLLHYSQVLVLLFGLACGKNSTPTIGLDGSKLRPCPQSPNCVNSNATGEPAIEAIEVNQDAEVVWNLLKATLKTFPDVEIVSSSTTYLHAEARSSFFGFVDDLEFVLVPEKSVIHLRSASRLGYYDFDANRERIELIRAKVLASLKRSRS